MIESRSRHVIAATVDGWCTRCRMILAHTIEAMIDQRITRVHCNTCHSQHTFRPHGPREQPSRPVAKRSPIRARAAPPAASDLDDMLRGRDLNDSRPYSVHQHFAVGEVLRHPSFGIGLVTAQKDRVKISVLFADGERTLRHAAS